ncbi:MerR family transcriptional regulator [Solihabitans fulvus]|uniref:MerR family transcriptional regulator n=1 Tax=Solihabitans fulvus TaxID=1892852 RepID=A0A5B2XPV1_9PSEU|nr:MerR family transcriptional regulator [Solihabitans fulvus]KAA2264889.1 MerR family transcriptional regulator [Solihabitans fulvus]
MAWSIAQVARMSKVTSRTLRHYDSIGLLTPAWVGDNGYRHYEQEQLFRLQQILLLRELGLGLDAIGEILDGRHETVAVLRNHLRWLREEQRRLGTLAATVSNTINQLEGGDIVAPDDLFEGFDTERQARYEAELVERFGEGAQAHIDETRRKRAGWTKQDYDGFQREVVELDEGFAALLDAGVPPTDPRAQELTERHYRFVCRSWTPNAKSYAGLGQLYVDSPEFRERYENIRGGLAEYLRDAMAAYAETRL